MSAVSVPPSSAEVVSTWGSRSPETSTLVETWPVFMAASTRRSVATSTVTPVATKVWKPVWRYGHGVGADGQLGDRVAAVGAGFGGALQSGAGVFHRDLRSGDDGAGGIGHGAENGSAEGLGRQAHGGQKNKYQNRRTPG